MTTDTTIIKSALDNLRPIIGRRNTLPILSCVKLHTEKNRLHLAVTNLDEYATERIEATGEISEICVPFNHFYESLLGKESEISVQKNTINIRCGDDQTTLPTLDAGEFVPMPKGKWSNQGISCPDLAKGINQVAWAASTDPSRYMINSVLIESSAKTMRVVSTNGRELAIFESAAIGSDLEAVLPSEFASNAAAALNRGGAIISTSENHIRISHDCGDYFCKMVEGKYPNYRNVIPANQKPLGNVSVEEFKAMMQSIVGYGRDDEIKGTFTFSKKELLVEFVDSGTSTTVSRRLQGKFEPFKAALATKKMLKIFQNLKTDEAHLFYCDEFSPLVIKSGELTVLTMPMRMA